MNKRGRPAGTINGKYPKRTGGKCSAPYVRWRGMLNRCQCQSHPAYPWYGGKGIGICERWLGKDGFDNFVDDMGWPLAGMTLDRLDNSKDYSPDNCRWATQSEQTRNRKSTRGIARDPNSLRQRSIRAGLDYHVVVNRVYYLGWSEERALSTPKQPRGRRPGWRPNGKAPLFK